MNRLALAVLPLAVGCTNHIEHVRAPLAIHVDPNASIERQGKMVWAVTEWVELGVPVRAEIGLPPACSDGNMACLVGGEMHWPMRCLPPGNGGGQINQGAGVLIDCDNLDANYGPDAVALVATHELGHAIGLGAPFIGDHDPDPDCANDVMCPWVDQVIAGSQVFRAAVAYGRLSAADAEALANAGHRWVGQ